MHKVITVERSFCNFIIYVSLQLHYYYRRTTPPSGSHGELTSIYASIYRTHAGVHITFIVIIYNIIIHIQDSESKLLLHPVVKSLLSWKWSRYIALFFFINLVLYLVFLSFLTAFALIVPNPQLSICE